MAEEKNKPSSYIEYKVLEFEPVGNPKRPEGYKITEKKPILTGDKTPKVCRIYPHEADIMNNGVNGVPNEVAVRTLKYYELEEKPKAKKE